MNLSRVDDWHLHLTVEPRSRDMMPGYVLTCDKVQWQPKVIENLMGDSGESTMRHTLHELIPTAHSPQAELGAALILLHDVAKVFALSGWIVRRLKVEGRVRPPNMEGLYAETHVQIREEDPFDWPVSRSLTSGKMYATMRSRDLSPEALDEVQLQAAEHGLIGAKWEYAIYDSNRPMDRAWFRSWGRNG